MSNRPCVNCIHESGAKLLFIFMSAAANSYSTLLQLIMTSLGSSWDAVGMASMYVRCSPPPLLYSVDTLYSSLYSPRLPIHVLFTATPAAFTF